VRTDTVPANALTSDRIFTVDAASHLGRAFEVVRGVQLVTLALLGHWQMLLSLTDGTCLVAQCAQLRL